MEAKPETAGGFPALEHNTPRWMPWHIVLLLCMFLPLPIVWAGFYLLHSYWIAAISYALIVCTLPSFLLAKRVQELSGSLSLDLVPSSRRFSRRMGAVAVLSMGGMLVGWTILSRLMIDWPHLPSQLAAVNCHQGFWFWIFVIYFIVVNPIAEEYFWRGIVYNTLKHLWGIPLAVAISCILFGGWHWVIIQHFFAQPWQIPLTLMIMLGGIIFTWAYERTNSLLEPILIHSLGADLPIMIILWQCLGYHA